MELDLLPAGNALGLGLVAFGLLTGKFGRDKLGEAGPGGSPPTQAGASRASGSDGRLNGDNPYGGMLFTEKNFDIVDALRGVAAEVGRSMVEVALSWVARRPGVSSVLTGVGRPDQVRENVASLDIALSAKQQARLNAAGAPPRLNPSFIVDLPRERIFGGLPVDPWR